MSYRLNPFTGRFDFVPVTGDSAWGQIIGSRLIPSNISNLSAIYYPANKHRVLTYVQGAGGTVGAHLADGNSDGDEHTLMGGGSNSVLLSSGQQEMNGDYTVSNGSVISFIWSAQSSTWVERSRNGL